MIGEDFEIPEGEETLSYDPVFDDLDEHEICCKLEECNRALLLGGSDVLYSSFPLFNFIVRKCSQLPASICQLCWKIILHELEVHTNALFECDMPQLDQSKKRFMKVSIKVLCYVAVNLGKAFEQESIHAYSNAKKGKKVTAGWQEERLKLMTLLVRLNNMELVHLWETPSAAMLEDLATLFASFCFKLLENPSVVRDKNLLDCIVELVSLTVKKYGLTLSVSLKLIQLLQHFDHSVTPISTIVVSAAGKYSCKQIILDMFREICSMNPSDLAMDASGTKSLSSFLLAVSSQLPAAVLPAVPVLLPHLSGESTTFRCGVLGVLGELLRWSPSSDGENDMIPDTRNQIFARVAEHLHDVNAFVRVKVLHILSQLCSAQAIPIPLLQGLLEKVAERLNDKSSLVRKAALQLLSGLLSANPFASQLAKEELTRKLEEEESVLENECSSEETVRHMAVVKYLEAALNFASLMGHCIPTAVEMLKSKVVTDVLESLEFLCVSQLFGIEGAQDAILKSLSLVWAQDERLRHAVVSTYVRLYVTSNNASSHSKQVVENLLKILSTATLGEIASLEKLVGLLVESGHIPNHTTDELWQIYNHPDKTEAIQACQLLAMVLPAKEGSNFSCNLNYIMSIGLKELNDLLLAKHVCCAIHKMAMSDPGVRLSNCHSLFGQIMFLLTRNFSSTETSQWNPLCEHGLNVVYQLSEQPNLLAEALLKDLSQLLKLKDGVNSIVLSRLLFCAGHVAQCQVLHCELHIAEERKKKIMDTHCLLASKGDVEEELGVGGGEDHEADFVRKIMETEVGGGTGMLTCFLPLIVNIVSNPTKFSCDQLQTAAATALSKFMLISPMVCNKYLQLFFTVLEKAAFSTVRANLIIAASDLVCRFPNTLEPWTPFLYSRLKDKCGLVRKNTIMVLTHLILNDMIKIRGQVSAMALCLEDPDSNIKNLSELFFYELSLKGNSLYNILPDIISQLTDPGNDMCSQASFRNIIRHLFQHIKKEKHQENLVDKLCHRLRAVRTEQQTHSLVYCLSLFTPTDKGLLKLYENFFCYQDKLSDDVVLKHIQGYLNKAKKLGVKQCEELERKLFEVIQKSQEDGRNPLLVAEDQV